MAQRRQAVALAQQGKLHQARVQFQQADEGCPGASQSTLAVRIAVLLDLGRFDEATVFSPSARLIGFGGRTGALVVWDVTRETPTYEREEKCPNCDATQAMFNGIASIAFVLGESAVFAGPTDGTLRSPGLFHFRRPPLVFGALRDVKAVLDDGRTVLANRGEELVALDLVTRAMTPLPKLGPRLFAVKNRMAVAVSEGAVQLIRPETGESQVVTRRHSTRFEAVRADGGALQIDGGRSLSFRLSGRQPATPPLIRNSRSQIQVYRDQRAHSWFTCPPAVSSGGAARFLTETLFAVNCGSELVLASSARPGVIARLRRIAQTDAMYALYEDGTAELWGDPEDLRRVASCKLGEELFPLELCEPELVVPGKLEALLR